MKQDREITESELVMNSNKINILNKNNKTIYFSTTGTYIVNFAESVDKSWIFTMEQGIYKVFFKLLNQVGIEEKLDKQTQLESIKDGHCYARAELKESRYNPTCTIRDKILYSSFMTGLDLQYTVQTDCVKEEIIINQKQDNYEYAYIMKLENLEPKLCEDGTILFISTDEVQAGEVVFKISPVVLCDSNGSSSDKAKFSLYKQLTETYLLRLSANAGWVNSESRTYPVALLLNYRVIRN